MFKRLIHKLKMRFGKKTKIAPLHIIYGTTHAADDVLNNCWGAITLVEQRKPNYKETH